MEILYDTCWPWGITAETWAKEFAGSIEMDDEIYDMRPECLDRRCVKSIDRWDVWYKFSCVYDKH